MAALILPSVRTTQPQGVARIDWSNPICKGLVSYSIPSVTDGTQVALNRFGVSGRSVLPAKARNTTDPITILTIATQITSTANNPTIAAASNWNWSSASTNGGLVLFRQHTTGYLYTGVWNNNDLNVISTTFLTLGQTYILAVVYDGATTTAYCEGVNVASAATPLGFLSGGGSQTFGYSEFTGTSSCSLGLVFNRALSALEIASLSANPWQVFAPQQRRLWVVPSPNYNFIAQKGYVDLDFGTGGNEATTFIADATISTTSKADTYIMADDSTTDHTSADHKYLPCFINLTAEVIGTTGVQVTAVSEHKLSGKFRARCVWAN